MKVFLDANIPMYAAGKAHAHREPSIRLLRRVQSHEIEGVTSTEVLQEILNRYSAMSRRDLAAKVYDLFVEICPTVFDITIADTDLARSLLVDVEAISARYAIHVAVMRNHGIDRVATFDSGFDAVPGLSRLVPE